MHGKRHLLLEVTSCTRKVSIKYQSSLQPSWFLCSTPQMSLLKTCIRKNANLEANLDASKTPPSTAFLLQETSLRPESVQPKSEKSWRSLLPFLTLSVKIRHVAKEKKQPIGVFVGSFLPSVIIESSGGWISMDFINSTVTDGWTTTSPNQARVNFHPSFTQYSNYAEMWTSSQVFSKLKKKARDQNNLKASHFGDASLLVNSVSVLLTTLHISAIDLSSHIDQIRNIYLHINLLHSSVLRSTEFGCEIMPVSRKMSLYPFQYKLYVFWV